MGFKDFIRDERGVTAIEYGLIAALIFIVVIGAIAALGPVAKKPFVDYDKAMSSPPSSG